MAITKEINIVANTQEAQRNVDNLNTSVKEVDKSSEQLETQNKATAKSAKGVGTAVKGIGTALKAIGIGVVIALFAKLADVFGKNQKVLDFFATTGTSLSIVFNDFFSIFTDGTLTFENFGQLIKDNIVERFNSLLKVTGLVGIALKKVFEGDFAGAFEVAKSAGVEMVDVFTGVDNSLSKITSYTEDVWEQAEATTALANASALAEVRLQGLIEKYDRDAEIQRERRDNFNLSAQERLEASERLGEILDEQEKAQIRLANISVASARAQIAATGDNIENQVALQQALNEVAATEAQVTGFRTEQKEQQRALEKELLELRKEEIGEIVLTENNATQNKIDNLAAEIQATEDARKREAEINEKYAREEAQRAQYLEDFKLNIAQAGLAALSNLAESGSAFAKGIAIAQAVISTYQGINKALAETTDFTPTQTLRFANAAAVGIAGFANVANILRTNTSNPSFSGAGVGQPTQAAPSFNVVGTSGESQLAQTLNQQQEPIEAYVVAGNVSSAQEANRNIVETATIG